MLHPVGEASHLRVAALAGVAADGVGQLRYLPEGFEDLVADQDLARGAATLRVGAALPELADLAEGTAQRAGLVGLCRIPTRIVCARSRASASARWLLFCTSSGVSLGASMDPVAWREDY